MEPVWLDRPGRASIAAWNFYPLRLNSMRLTLTKEVTYGYDGWYQQ